MSRTTQQSGRTPDGRSSIYRGNDGAWHGYVTMGVRPDGRPDRRHRRGKTEAEVTRKVRELEGKRDAGAASRTGRVPTVAQWMRIYIDDVAPLRVSQSTIDSTYRPKIERWIIPRLGKHRLDRLLPEHLYSFYASLKAEGLAPNALDCTKHASSCPKRVGGWTFARPKGGRKRAVPIPPELVEPLRQHLASQDAERQAAADAWDGRTLSGAGQKASRSTRTTTGKSGRPCSPRPESPRTPGCTTPGTPPGRCWGSSMSTCT